MHVCTEEPCPECLHEMLEGAAKWEQVPILHVYPVDDLYEHSDDGSSCDCDPRVILEEEGHITVIHNAFDRRELSEENNPSLN